MDAAFLRNFSSPPSFSCGLRSLFGRSLIFGLFCLPLFPGGRLLVYRRNGPVTITYTTRPTEGDREALYHTVLRYATADYDGAETQELNRILSEARQ